MPQGKLICTRNQDRYKWYVSDGHSHTYLPKTQRTKAEQLAIKKYLTLQLQEATKEKDALEFYLRHHHDAPHRSHELLYENPAYRDLLSSYFKPQAEELRKWASSPYPPNPKFPEQLSIQTISGHFVRSKSEALIDMLLYVNKIPYRYECALQLGDVTIYPDFTLRHPETGVLIYWEHFGKMDDPGYRQKAFSKLQLYSAHGIIPSINLITTYETSEHPLGTHNVEQIITQYFK